MNPSSQLLPSQAFQFSSDNLQKLHAHIAKYPEGRQASAVIPALDLAQRQCGGWLPVSALEEVARLLSMPAIRVHEVASFYSMFNLKPVGRYHVQVCGTTPCMLRGALDIRHACEAHLGIKLKETTADDLFTLTEVECLGACVNAPMVQINDNYYEDLTPDSMVQLLKDFAEGKTPKEGSQCGRQGSEAHNTGTLSPTLSNLNSAAPETLPSKTPKPRKKRTSE